MSLHVVDKEDFDMKFIYTQADIKQGNTVISGYFAADNTDEAELLAEMAKSAEDGKLGEHLGSNGKTIAFNHIQESLLKMNVTRIRQMMGIKDFTYVIGNNFKGDKALIH